MAAKCVSARRYLGTWVEHDYRHSVAPTSELLQHSHAVEARQHDVQDNNLGIELRGRFKPRRSIALAPHFEITLFQLQLQEAGRIVIIFYDQYTRSRSHTSSLACYRFYTDVYVTAP